MNDDDDDANANEVGSPVRFKSLAKRSLGLNRLTTNISLLSNL